MLIKISVISGRNGLSINYDFGSVSSSAIVPPTKVSSQRMIVAFGGKPIKSHWVIPYSSKTSINCSMPKFKRKSL